MFSTTNQGRPVISPQQQEIAEAQLRDELLDFENTEAEKKRLNKFGRAVTLAWFIVSTNSDTTISTRQLIDDVLSRNYDILEAQHPGMVRSGPEMGPEGSTEYVRYLTKVTLEENEELAAYCGMDVSPDDEPFNIVLI